MKFIIKNSLLLVIIMAINSCGNDSKNKTKVTTKQEQDQNQQQTKADDFEAKITTVQVHDHNQPSLKIKDNDVSKKDLNQSPKEKWNNIILPKPDEVEDEFEEYVEVVAPEYTAYYKAYNKVLPIFNTMYHELNVLTSKGTAHVIVSGPKNGLPVVLLHGMNASSTSWYPNMKALSQKYRVYAIDNIMEPGKSQLKGEIKDMDEVVKWYFEVFDKLNLKSFYLIGASKGGWLSVSIALQQKNRVKRLILLSPAQTFIWIHPGSKILSNITYKVDPNRNHLREVLKTVSSNVDNIDDAFIDQYYLATEANPKNKFILEMRPYSDSELKTLTMPVLLLIGDHDIVNNEKSIKKANKLLPNCKAGIVTNAGHFLSIDQSELVNKKMLDFLE